MRKDDSPARLCLHASDGGSMEPPTGTIFGHEFSGEIVEIGKHLDLLEKKGIYKELCEKQLIKKL